MSEATLARIREDVRSHPTLIYTKGELARLVDKVVER
jgi:hypothetical protein